MAMTKRQVDVSRSSTEGDMHLRTMPVYAEITRTASAAANGPTAAVSVTGVAGDKHIIKGVYAGFDADTVAGTLIVGDGSKVLRFSFVNQVSLENLNLVCAAGTAAVASVTSASSTAATLNLLAYTLDE